ncbi:MAG: helix-turn-helix transcriptional regulator [Ruminococcus sp.]|nr:helix-turn-helix transcriptional regulator [Ruminococcus sp.]
MNNPQEIANLIRFQTSTQKINISQMFTNIGLGKNTLSNLDNGSMIKADSLGKIADYLNVSVDYLLGRTSNSQGMSNNHLNAVDIQGYNVQTIGGGEVISKRDKELLQKINSLSFDDYVDIINYINSKLRSNT